MRVRRGAEGMGVGRTGGVVSRANTYRWGEITQERKLPNGTAQKADLCPRC